MVAEIIARSAIMSRMTKASILSIIVFFFFLIIHGCDAHSSAQKLHFQEAVLARMVAGNKLARTQNEIFKKGEQVYLVLLHVGKFKQGKDGLNWFDINAKVTAPDGEVIFSKKDMLGKRGNIKIANGIVRSPHVIFKTSDLLSSGEYKIRMTIYDKIGSGIVSVGRKFILK